MTPQRLTPRTHSQSASELSQAETPAHTPALLHSRWTAPKAARARWAKASTSWALDTSVTTASTGVPVACRAAAVAVKVSPSTSATTTFIPSCAHRSASARPMPLAAPVITATLSVNACMAPSSCRAGRHARVATRVSIWNGVPMTGPTALRVRSRASSMGAADRDMLRHYSPARVRTSWLLAAFGETGWFEGWVPFSWFREDHENQVVLEAKFLYFPHGGSRALHFTKCGQEPNVGAFLENMGHI